MTMRMGDQARAATPARYLAAILLALASVTWASAQSPPGGEPAAAPAASLPPGSAPQTQPSRANIVILLIDSLRADRLGAYGYDHRPTSPRIDALAREAVVFEQAYTPAPWTLPALASLMTATFPCEHRAFDERRRLSDSVPTLAERLKRLDYTTLGLFANVYAGPRYGIGRGYDDLKPSLENDGRKVGRLLKQHPATPFFLYIHNTEPQLPQRFAPAHTDGFQDVPQTTRVEIQKHCRAYRQLAQADFKAKRRRGTTDNTAEQDQHLAALSALSADYSELYDAAVRLADSRVGSVIDVLKQRGVWDNTLFIVLSDHGEEFGEHGGWLHDQSVYEEVVRVPLIIHFPHGQHAGQRVQSVVSLVDVLPTVFDYLGAPDAALGARGRSVLPLVRGGTSAATDDFVVPSVRVNHKNYYRPWKESRGDVNVVVRRGSWKAIWNREPNTLELYDLSTDPREQHDLGAENPELAVAMQAFARVWYEACRGGAMETPQDTAAPDAQPRRNPPPPGRPD
jgi:arylsulfatase A-like enzyme